MNEPVERGILQVVSSDARRTIREVNFQCASFQSFEIKEDAGPLGQHFHREKFEVFSFASGGGRLLTAEVNERGEIIGEIQEYEIEPSTTFYIPPFQTHRFDLRVGTEFTCFSSKPFNRSDLNSCPIG